MDIIAKQTSVDIAEILEPTIRAFIPLLQARKSAIDSIKSETFQYGPTERHRLDVYYPPFGASAHALLFFVYGGGFTSGEKRFPPPADLIYSGVGAFFAARGFTTVIPDYHLAPAAKYPLSAEDVRDAFQFIQESPADVTGIEEEDREKAFILGHSAGGVHVSTVLLHEPPLLAPELAKKIKGAILSGTPFHFRTEGLRPIGLPYYGTTEKMAASQPLTLLQAAPESVVKALPSILLGHSERDLEVIKVAEEEFAGVLTEKSGRKVERRVWKGHNHVSVNLALNSGEGEEWGEGVVQWCKEQL